MDAFPRLRHHQQNLKRCIERDEFKDDILTDLWQYPCALFYSGNVKTRWNFVHNQSQLNTERILLNTAVGTKMPNVCVCVLRGEYGHLTSTVSESFYFCFLNFLSINNMYVSSKSKCYYKI